MRHSNYYRVDWGGLPPAYYRAHTARQAHRAAYHSIHDAFGKRDWIGIRVRRCEENEATGQKWPPTDLTEKDAAP